MEYVRWAVKRGLDIDAFAPRLSFFFNCHNDFLEEIAKFRAARRIWAREMRHTFGAKNPRSWWLRFHTQTAGCTLTAQQPEINVVRVAIQALAAVLGGTQSLHTNSLDEALALPSEYAVTIALRTQQIIAHESGVVNTVDPLGGSYAIETLTDRLERQAYEYFDKIEALGGVIPAIETGFFQQEIANAAGTLVGQNLGAGKPDRAERSAWWVSAYAGGYMVVVATLLFLFAPSLIRLFDSAPEVVSIGTECLRIVAPTLIASAVGVVLARGFDGAGNTVPAMAINLLSLWALEVPLAWGLSRLWGVTGLWWGRALANLVNGLLFALWFRRGRWKERKV